MLAIDKLAPYNIPHMANAKALFPQISGFFSALVQTPAAIAVGRACLWLGIAALVAVNVFSLKITSPLSAILTTSLTNPYSIATHVDTAKKLWDLGFRETATRELVIAKDLVSEGGSVLGATRVSHHRLASAANHAGGLRVLRFMHLQRHAGTRLPLMRQRARFLHQVVFNRAAADRPAQPAIGADSQLESRSPCGAPTTSR